MTISRSGGFKLSRSSTPNNDDTKPLLNEKESSPSINSNNNTENSNGNLERFQELKERNNRIKTLRTKKEYELERTEKELAECLEEAKKYGVSSLQELKDLIKQKQTEESQALEQYEAALDKEEETLNKIDENLNRLN